MHVLLVLAPYWSKTGNQTSCNVTKSSRTRLKLQVGADQLSPFSRWMSKQISSVKLCTSLYIIQHSDAQTNMWSNDKRNTDCGNMVYFVHLVIRDIRNNKSTRAQTAASEITKVDSTSLWTEKKDSYIKTEQCNLCFKKELLQDFISFTRCN